jgi:hypothetical protein
MSVSFRGFHVCSLLSFVLAKWVLCVSLFVGLLMSGFCFMSPCWSQTERERETETDEELFLHQVGGDRIG